jgi:hypothetical protein
MKQRCNNPNKPSYINYGARGITVCKEWLIFKTFENWAITSGYQNDLTIERINNDIGYSPENCKWIPKSDQTKNRRITNWLTIDGHTNTIQHWCKLYKVPHCTAMRHLHKGEDMIHYFTNAESRRRHKRNGRYYEEK